MKKKENMIMIRTKKYCILMSTLFFYLIAIFTVAVWETRIIYCYIYLLEITFRQCAPLPSENLGIHSYRLCLDTLSYIPRSLSWISLLSNVVRSYTVGMAIYRCHIHISIFLNIERDTIFYFTYRYTFDILHQLSHVVSTAHCLYLPFILKFLFLLH